MGLAMNQPLHMWTLTLQNWHEFATSYTTQLQNHNIERNYITWLTS